MSPHLPEGYSAVRTLRESDWAHVVLVSSPGHPRFRILKLYSIGTDRSSFSASRFEAELAVLGSIEHPQIVALDEIGVDSDGERGYLVLEYLEGPNICSAAQHTSREVLSNLMLQAAIAVETLHRRQIIHGDLKSDHFLLELPNPERGVQIRLKLIDMATAVVSHSAGRRLERCITPEYAAPELLAGTKPDFRSDIYSLGLVLIECLAPHELLRTPGHRETEQIVAKLSASYSSPSFENDVLRLARQMADGDPHRRPSDATSVTDHIARLMETHGLPIWNVASTADHVRMPILVGMEELHSRFESMLSIMRTSTTSCMRLEVSAPPGGGLSRAFHELKLVCAKNRIPGRYILRSDTGRSESLATSVLQPVHFDESPDGRLHAAAHRSMPSRDPEQLARFVIVGRVHTTPVQHPSSSHSAQPTILPSAAHTLKPLTRASLAGSLAATLGLRTVPVNVVDRVMSSSGGNPSRAWRYLRFLFDSHQLSLEGDHLVLNVASVPDDESLLDGTSTHRAIETMPPQVLSVGRVLALSHAPLTNSDLIRVTDQSPSAIGYALSQLVSSGLIEMLPAADAHRHECAGSLVRILLKHGLQPTLEGELHARLADTLASAADDWTRLYAAAQHARLYDDTSLAISLYSRAAAGATTVHNHAGAISCYSAALSLLPDGTPSATTLLFGLAGSYRARGLPAQSLDALQRIRLDTITSARQHFEVLLLTCKLHSGLAHYARAIQYARRALHIARTHAWIPDIARCLAMIGVSLVWLDHRRRGFTLLMKAARLARKVHRLDILTAVLTDLALTHWEEGRYRVAASYEKRRLRLLAHYGDSEDTANSAMNLGIVAVDLGLFRTARRSYMQCLRHTKTSESVSLRAAFLINHGESYRARGHWRVAYRMYSQALNLFATSGEGHRSAIASVNSARVLCMTGDLGMSVRTLRTYRAQSFHPSTTTARVMHLLCWGHALRACGAPIKARRVFAMAGRIAHASHRMHTLLESSIGEASCLVDLNDLVGARLVLSRTLLRDASRAPYEVVMSARLVRIRVRARSQPMTSSSTRGLQRLIARCRSRGMYSHLAEALVELAIIQLSIGEIHPAEEAAREAVALGHRFGGKTISWQAHEVLGKCYERSLKHRRALSQFRAAALFIREIAMGISSPTLRKSYLVQPQVRITLDEYARMKQIVGRRARYDVAALNRREAVSRRMLASLSEIGQKLTSVLELSPLLSQILDLAIENTGAERGVIFLRDEMSGEFRSESARGVGGLDLDDLSKFSRSVLKQATEGRTLLTVDVGQDPVLQHATSISVNEIKSILCVPMRARGRVAGVLYLDTQRRKQLFSEKDRAFVEAFAGQAAVAIENARLFGSIRAENGRLRREMTGRFRGLLGTSEVMGRLRDLLAGVADSESTVLLTGESGTGKEVVARAIHLDGPRAGARFIPVDCGALPEHLLEAELFGCRRGAFTGAERDRAGLIEAANGGTLFLDEITNTSLALQARLLRVLQEREIRRLGETESRKVDVRIIAATNAEIEKMVSQGKFREDLYYRLNVVRVEVPPLRDRRDDIPLLAEHLLERRMAACKAAAGEDASAGDNRNDKRFGPGVLDALSRRDWPGNVRELENMVERLRVLTHGSLITLADLARVAGGVRGSGDGPGAPDVSGRVLDFPGVGGKTGEQLMIEDALRRCQGDKAKAARFIGWNRQKLYRRLKAFAIPVDFGKAA